MGVQKALVSGSLEPQAQGVWLNKIVATPNQMMFGYILLKLVFLLTEKCCKFPCLKELQSYEPLQRSKKFVIFANPQVAQVPLPADMITKIG